jgi:hypothetical protein
MERRRPKKVKFSQRKFHGTLDNIRLLPDKPKMEGQGELKKVPDWFTHHL